MVSLFPSPADVKAGVVDYVMNPTNVGYVTIAVVVLVVTFNLDGASRSRPRPIRHLARPGPRPRPTALTPPSPASIATSQVPPRNVLPPKKREFTTDHIIRALNDETYDQNILSGDKLKRIIATCPSGSRTPTPSAWAGSTAPFA